jgi:transcriptional regulator with XRE-family HTH domain
LQIQEPVTKIRHGLTMPFDKLRANGSLVLSAFLTLIVVSMSNHKTWNTWSLGRQQEKKRSAEEIASLPIPDLSDRVLSDEDLKDVGACKNWKLPPNKVINPFPAVRFGNQLRDLRKRAGLSQLELASLLGGNKSRIKKLEAGSSEPPHDSEFYESLRRVPGVTESDIAHLLQATGYDDTMLAELYQRDHAKRPPHQTSTVLHVEYVEGQSPAGTLIKVNDAEYILGLRPDLEAEVAEAIQAEAMQTIKEQANSQRFRGIFWPDPSRTPSEEEPQAPLTKPVHKDAVGYGIKGQKKASTKVKGVEGEITSHGITKPKPVQPNREEVNKPTPRHVRREFQRAHESLEQATNRLGRKYGEDELLATVVDRYEKAKGVRYQLPTKESVNFITVAQAAEQFGITASRLARGITTGLLQNVGKFQHPNQPEISILLVDQNEVQGAKSRLEALEEEAKPRLLTLKQAAAAHGIPVSTLHTWHQRGDLPEKGREIFQAKRGGKINIMVDENDVISLKLHWAPRRRTKRANKK